MAPYRGITLPARDALVGASFAVAFIHFQLAESVRYHLSTTAPDARLLQGILLVDAVHAVFGAGVALVLGFVLRGIVRAVGRARAGGPGRGVPDLTRRGGLWLSRTAAVLLASSTLALGILLILADNDFQIRPGPAPSLAGSHEGRPNVLLIVADSLRRDVFDDEAAVEDLAPNLAAFRKEACDYTAHQAVCSWTPPSMAGILSGRYPGELGAHGGMLPAAAVTLAERLRAAGYETSGISDNYLTSPEFGFAQGHDHYWQKNNCALFSRLWFNHWRLFRYYEWLFHAFEYQYRGAPAVNEQTMRWAERRDESRPFYVMLHYMDTHYPYYVYPDEPDNVSNQSTPDTYTPYYEAQILVRQGPKPPFATASLPPEKVEDFRTRYRGSLQYLDGYVGEIFDWLKRTDQWDSTLVVFTSDHGEEFFEHHYLGHGRTLYQESTRVPLMIKWPRAQAVAPETIDVPVSHLQIMPTVLRAAGIEIPEELLPPLPTRPQTAWKPIFSEFDRSGIRIYSGRFDRFKLAYSRIEGGSDLLELYDLQADPEELENLEAQRSELPEEMLLAFQSFVDRFSATSFYPEIENAEELRSLGYLR
jgi:arylsulfatase A-like enzyme